VAYVLLNPDSGIEYLPNGRARTKVFVDLLTIEQAYRTLNDHYRTTVEIPGFRKGAAVPENVIIGAVGKDLYYLAVLEEVLKLTVSSAFDQLGNRVIDGTETIETETKEMVDSLRNRQPWSFAVSADILPEVKWKVPFKDVKVVVKTSDIGKVADEDKVEELIETFRKEQASLQIPESGTVQRGSLLVLEAQAVRKDTGEPALNVPRGPFKVDTDQSMIPNFVENIEGLGINEEKEFDIKMPDKWEDTSVQGATVHFTVKISEIFERKLPDLDDTIAAQISPGATTLKEARATLLERVRASNEEDKKNAYENAMTESIAGNLDCEVPVALVNEIGREQYGQQLMQLQAQGTLSDQMMQKLTAENLVLDFIEKERSTFEMLAKASIGIGELYRTEVTPISEEELQSEIEEVRQSFMASGQKPEDIDEDKLKSIIKERSEAKRVFEWVEKSATIEYA